MSNDLSGAIKHALEAAEKYEKISIYTPIEFIPADTSIEQYQKRADEQRQLAAWLKELEQRRRQRPEMDIIKSLEAFIEAENQRSRDARPLRDWVKYWILEKIVAGECEVTGSATDHSTKKMFVEFTFYGGQ